MAEGHNKRTEFREVLELSKTLNIRPMFGAKDFKNQHQRLKYKCLNPRCKHQFPKTFTKMKHSYQGCTQCSSTLLYERIVRIHFEKMLGNYFPKCKIVKSNYSTRRLELDGYCEDLNIAFEHQGQHHFKPMFPGNEGKENLKLVRLYDREKKAWCKEKKILLIIVNELQTYIKIHKLEDYLLEEFKKNHVEVKPSYTIDLSPAYRYDPVKEYRAKLNSIGIDSKLEPWRGQSARYSFFCKTCKYGDDGNWAIILNNALMSKGCPHCNFYKNRYWSDDEIVKKILELKHKLKRVPFNSDFSKHSNMPSSRVVSSRFGKYNDALRMAGLAPNKEKSSREILLNLLRTNFRNQATISYTDVKDHDLLPSPTTFGNHFKGGLKTAVEMVGKVYPEDPAYTKDELVDILRDYIEANGRPPIQTQLGAKNKLPVIDTFIAHFDTYNNAVKAAGGTPNREVNLPNKKLLLDLKRLSISLGKAPSNPDIDAAKGMVSARTYFDRYGSLPNAWKLAGIAKPKRKLRTTKYTEKEITDYFVFFYKKQKHFPTETDVTNDKNGPSMMTVRRRGGFRKFSASASNKLGLKKGF